LLVAVLADDTPADLKALTTKILSLKMFPAPQPAKGEWKANVKDIGGEILCGQSSSCLS
jgi:D-Tyr-tRNAtyr deacylase